jgi:hypothetical protein
VALTLLQSITVKKRSFKAACVKVGFRHVRYKRPAGQDQSAGVGQYPLNDKSGQYNYPLKSDLNTAFIHQEGRLLPFAPGLNCGG